MTPLKHLIAAVMNAAAAKLMPRVPDPMQALPSFAGQHTNPLKNEKRMVLRAVGRRQFKKRKLHHHFRKEA